MVFVGYQLRIITQSHLCPIRSKWGDARHYHLAISSVYGVDFAVEVLKHAAESFPGGTEK